MKQTVCNKCEEYCVIDVKTNDEVVEIIGNKCKVGIELSDKYLEASMEVLTTLVRIKGGNIKVVSVKSDRPIEKKLFLKCSRALSRINIGAPIKIGDVVCKNILNLGVDIICTKNVDRI
jgi:CxxC motif-containing protein